MHCYFLLAARRTYLVHTVFLRLFSTTLHSACSLQQSVGELQASDFLRHWLDNAAVVTSAEGRSVGVEEGLPDGTEVDGSLVVGTTLGRSEGTMEGIAVGELDMAGVGWVEGSSAVPSEKMNVMVALDLLIP